MSQVCVPLRLRRWLRMALWRVNSEGTDAHKLPLKGTYLIKRYINVSCLARFDALVNRRETKTKASKHVKMAFIGQKTARKCYEDKYISLICTLEWQFMNSR